MQPSPLFNRIRFVAIVVVMLSAMTMLKAGRSTANGRTAFDGQLRPAPDWKSSFDFRNGASMSDRILPHGDDWWREFSLASNSRNANLRTMACPTSFTVNDLGDTSDANAGNQACADSNGKCTLRAAIEEANAITACTPLTINFTVTGTISLATALPDLNHPNLTITGPGASSLTVQRSTVGGTANFRIFTINSGKTVAISGLTITNGNAGTNALGGGVRSSGTLSLSDCLISGNTTGTGLGTFGGGIYATGSLTMTRCTVSGNTSRNGAGIATSDSTVTITNSTLSGNTASNQAGAFILQRATATLTSCTISGNTANGSQTGGGVVNAGDSGETNLLTLVNCTITSNTGSNGAGIKTSSSSSTNIVTQLKNTLVAGNSGSNFSTSGSNASVSSQGNNLDSDGTSGFTNGVNGDLVGTAANKLNGLLSSLGNYGGTTQTHALLPGSPAINAGTSSSAPDNDQRGSSRVGSVDIGAFESQGFTLAIAGGNNQSAGASTNFGSPLSVAVTANIATEPVNGGQLTFTPPASGASATINTNPATIANGTASSTATANTVLGGPYNVAAATGGATASVTFSLTNVCPTIKLISPLVSTSMPGVAFSQSFTQSGGVGTTTFSMTGALPTGITLSTDGGLSGTTNQTGVFPIVVTATDANGCTGTGTAYPLTIYTSLMLSPAPVPEVLYYKFDGTGTTVPNLASAPPAGTANATLMGGLTQGGGADLCPATAGGTLIGTGGGSASDFLNTGWTTNLSGTSWTISFKASNISPSIGSFYMFGDNSANSFRCFAEGAAGAGNWLLRGSGMTDVLVTGAGTAVTTVTLVYDASASTIKAYVNGNLVNTVAQGPLSFIGTGPFKVSGYSTNPGLPNGGLMDDFRLYNRALNELEVLSISNCTRSCAYSIAPASQNFTVGGGSGSVTVTTGASCDWTAASNDAWITLADFGGTGSGAVGFMVAATTGAQRTGTATIAGQTFTVTQDALNCPAITVNPSGLPNGFVGTAYSATFSASGGSGSYTFEVSAGTKPPGLALASGGALTGTPTAQGTYNFTVKATDGSGCSDARSYTVIISGDGLMFYPLPRPVRLMDTRAGQGNCDNVSTPITAGTSLTTLAHTTCEGVTIPTSAQAIVGNLTAINQSAQSGYLTIYPDGQPVPLASNMIYTPGQIIANNFTVGLSSDGRFNVFGERSIDVVVDISGYFAPPGAGGLYYHPLSKPIRLLDTRPNEGNCDNVSTPIAAGTSITTLARTTCEGLTIPATAQALAANATVINGSGRTGYLTIYPNGVPVPLASNLIYYPGRILSNAFTVGLSANGEFNIFGERQIDMIVDVAGYYSDEATDANGQGLLFTPLARPLRILDTRAGQGNCDNVSTPIASGTSITTPARLTCEGITIPATAQSVLGNVTAINQTSQAGYLTLYPDGLTAPLISNMVYFPGDLLANAFVVGLNGGTGQFRIFAERTLDAVVDVSGYFAP